MQSGKSEENSQRENIFPPMPANLTNEMLLDENCDEEYALLIWINLYESSE